MNFIVMIFENGDTRKINQDDPLYAKLMRDVRSNFPNFTPYSDDTTAKYYDVIGSNFHTRFLVQSSTTTTTTTK